MNEGLTGADRTTADLNALAEVLVCRFQILDADRIRMTVPAHFRGWPMVRLSHRNARRALEILVNFKDV